MATINTLTLTASWAEIYDPATAGDFTGIAYPIGAVVCYVGTSAPSATDRGVTLASSGVPFGLFKVRGVKLYARAASSGAGIVLDDAYYPSGFPDGIFTGTRAMTTQTYTEANVKNGLSYEAVLPRTAFAGGADLDVFIQTGSKPVIVKSVSIGYSGRGITSTTYESPTVSANGTAIPVYNSNRISPVAGEVALYSGPAVSIIGTKAFASSVSIGSSGNGQTTTGSYALAGNERILKPNTKYLRRVHNDDTDSGFLTIQFNWYEGTPDLPLP